VFPQLHSHILGALNTGASMQEICGILDQTGKNAYWCSVPFSPQQTQNTFGESRVKRRWMVKNTSIHVVIYLFLFVDSPPRTKNKKKKKKSTKTQRYANPQLPIFHQGYHGTSPARQEGYPRWAKGYAPHPRKSACRRGLQALP